MHIIRFIQASFISFIFLLTSLAAVASDRVSSSSDAEYYRTLMPLKKNKKQQQGFYSSSFSEQQETDELDDIWAGIGSSFSFPFEQLYIKEHPSEWRNLGSGFSGGFSLGYPLTESRIQSGGEREGDLNAHNISYSASLKYKLLGNWFFSAAVIKYQNDEFQRTWNPDFVYTFGYSDWRPYTFSLLYANYGGNRLNPNRAEGEKATIFKQGAWTLSWKFPIAPKYSKYFTFTEAGRIGCNVGVSFVPEYFDSATSSLKKWKKTGSLGCKYTISGPWYFNATAFYYFDKSQQQPWNPDFTYGFGYFDWRPGTITIQYNNYSGNRWPGKQRAEGTGLFKSGGISIAWSWVF